MFNPLSLIRKLGHATVDRAQILGPTGRGLAIDESPQFLKQLADEIHARGLAEVERIEREMLAILDAQGIQGTTLAGRIEQLNTAPAQNFPNTDAGRAEAIAYLHQINDRVMAAAPKFFLTIPPQPLEIVRVPEYSQDSSPGGYYNPPALDGSRPGRFYINQKDTADNPKWKLPTLMIHEGAPGHHFQRSAQQLIKGGPMSGQNRG